jgi:hypothetical protein
MGYEAMSDCAAQGQQQIAALFYNVHRKLFFTI